jgi:hypothetical protein
MRSGKPKPQGSYLFSVLADGSKPFRFRSGVCSLLGIPEDERGKSVSARTLPPVGFKYIYNPFYYQMWSTPESSETFASENISFQELDDMKQAENFDITSNRQDRFAGQSYKPIDDGGQHFSAPTRPNPQAVAPELPENDKSLDKKTKIARMEIPGISEKKETFPALLNSVERNVRLSKAEDQTQQQVYSADLSLNVSNESFKEPKKIFKIKNKPNFAKVSLSQQKAEPEKKLVAVEPSSKHLQRSVNENMAARKNEQIILENNTSLATPSSSFGGEAAAKPYYLRKLSISGHPGINSVSRSSRKAAETIEHLRHAVHKLSNKVSVQQNKPEFEPKQQNFVQPQQSSSQPIFIIKQGGQQSRTPCAFWERSYLGRFHLRPLR